MLSTRSSLHGSTTTPRMFNDLMSSRTSRKSDLQAMHEAALSTTGGSRASQQSAMLAKLQSTLPPLALTRAWCLYECGLAM